MLVSDAGAFTISKLRFYSVGIVAQNKTLSSDTIEVVPMEDTPFLDGEISSTQATQTATGTNADGTTTTTSVGTAASILAKWLPFCDSNRMTAPDVRRGHVVWILQYGDADQYFWTTLKEAKNLMRLETVIYGFSGNPNNDVENNATNMYFLELSTHRKVVHFHTSKANGEPYTYDIQLDTGNGKFTITDDIGNYVFLDSAQHQIYAKNVDGSIYDMNKENITITAPKVIKNICEDYIVQASNKMECTATNKFSVDTTASTISAKSTASMTAVTTTLSGSSSLSCTGAGAGISASGGGASVTATGPMRIQSSDTTII